MSKVTRLFIDAASENVEAIPKRLADLGVRYAEGPRGRVHRASIRELYDRYYGASLSEIDPMQLIREAFQLIYAMNLRLPTRFLMLDKAIATLGAVGVELYPDFNVFEVAKPYARDLVLQRLTPERVARRRAQGGGLAGLGRAARRPTSGTTSSSRRATGRSRSGSSTKALDEFMPRSEQGFNRLVIALVVAGGLIGSAV